MQKQKLCESVHMFDVPDNLKFGSFDSLIKLVDDLVKFDSQVESVVRRVERQSLDLDASVKLTVTWQRSELPADEYVTKFRWDDIKYPRARTVHDNIQLLLTGVQKIDEEVKVKSQQYSDAKQQALSLARKDQVTHIQRDLVDVLTPESVAVDDFVYTEHLTTIVVIVPRGSDVDFLAQYEKFDEYVVPESAKRLAADDKEGNSIWRVVMFKTAQDSFKTHCRQQRYTVRDFIYEPSKHAQVLEARQASEAELRRQETIVKRICQGAFSDSMVAWMHLKAIRIFVESVLRFGVPPNFGAYLVRPNSSKTAKLRVELADTFATSGMFGTAMTGDSTGATEDEAGEYFPYVYLPFAPLASR